MKRAGYCLIAALLMLPAVAQAGGGGHSAACGGFSEGSALSMEDSCFQGFAHFVSAGDTLTVRNDGRLPHTITAVDGSFDSGQVGPGETFELALDQAGVVKIYCTLHGTTQGDGMAGVLVVGDAGGQSAASALPSVALATDSAPPGMQGAVTANVFAGLALLVAAAALVISLRRSRSPVAETASG